MSVHYRTDFDLYWPDYCQKPNNNFKYMVQHLHDMDYAISHVRDHQVAVQAGGNVGLWPIHLAKMFDEVITFEPEKDLFKCLELNARADNIISHNKALGSIDGAATFKRSTSCGSNRLDASGTELVEVITLDSLNLYACDIILLDIEGHELQALEGARETINRFQPVLMIEELNRDMADIDSFLLGLGYNKDRKVGNDRVYIC